MKQINDFINEKLKLNKNTKMANDFSDNYVIMIPYGDNYYFLEDHYESESFKSGPLDLTCYLFNKKNAIDIFNQLPDKALGWNNKSFVLIFLIPENITSETELIDYLHDNDSCIDTDDDDNNSLWKKIDDIDELKK